MRTVLAVFRICLLLVAVMSHPALGQDSIPTTSGFSGFVLAGPGYFDVETNLIVTGSPLLDDVGNFQIDSIFASPLSKTAPAFLLAGQLNYTFASTRTQLFIGNRLEDILRLDIAVSLGVRQELSDESILAASLLATPLDLQVWSDPYIEREDRVRTELDFPGARLRWARIMKTGLELTANARKYRHDEEKSGDWLVSQGRLAQNQQALLDRDGYKITLQALYRIESKQHRFEPAIRYINDNHDGASLARRGYGVQLTYLYLSPKLVLDANVIYGNRKADEIHPIYGVVLESDRWGAALTAFFPVKEFNNSRLSVFVTAEIFQEDANADFYDSKVSSISTGVIWRRDRP